MTTLTPRPVHNEQTMKYWNSQKLVAEIKTGHPLCATTAASILASRDSQLQQAIEAIQYRLEHYRYEVQVDASMYSGLLALLVELHSPQAAAWMRTQVLENKIRHHSAAQCVARELCALAQVEDVEVALTLSVHPDISVRRIVAQGLRHFARGTQPWRGYDPSPGKLIVSHLCELAQDEDSEIAATALASLSHFKRSLSETQVRVIVRALGNDSEKVRISAAKALRPFLGDHWDVVQPRLRLAFLRYESCSSDLGDVIYSMLKDFGGSRAHEEAKHLLLLGICSENGFHAAKCARELANGRDHKDITALGEALLIASARTWSDPQNALASAIAKLAVLPIHGERQAQDIGFEPRDKAVEYFLAALRHELRETRCAGVLGLQELGTDQVIPALQSALASDAALLATLLNDLPTEKPRERMF